MDTQILKEVNSDCTKIKCSMLKYTIFECNFLSYQVGYHKFYFHDNQKEK